LWRGSHAGFAEGVQRDQEGAEKGKNKRMFYAKEFDGNISTSDTPTRHHRVIINVDQ
jgi:hypothetical protein